MFIAGEEGRHHRSGGVRSGSQLGRGDHQVGRRGSGGALRRHEECIELCSELSMFRFFVGGVVAMKFEMSCDLNGWLSRLNELNHKRCKGCRI
jgi:hypothetical protein